MVLHRVSNDTLEYNGIVALHDHGDGYRLTCEALNIEGRKLYTGDLTKAVERSQGIVCESATDAMMRLIEFSEEDTDVIEIL